MPGIRSRCEVCSRQFRIPEGTKVTRCADCRGGEAPVTPLRPSRGPVTGAVETATLATLVDAGREQTALGQVTLKLAREFDAAEGVAAQRISESLRKSLAEALAGAAPPADALDELRRRREAKAANA